MCRGRLLLVPGELLACLGVGDHEPAAAGNDGTLRAMAAQLLREGHRSGRAPALEVAELLE